LAGGFWVQVAQRSDIPAIGQMISATLLYVEETTLFVRILEGFSAQSWRFC